MTVSSRGVEGCGAAACTPQDKVIRTHLAAAYVSQQQQKNNMPHEQ
jgi:hypothetical protein